MARPRCISESGTSAEVASGAANSCPFSGPSPHRASRDQRRAGHVHRLHAMKPSVAAIAAMVLAGASAQAARLDDSLSPRQRVETTTRFVHPSPRGLTEDQLHALVAEVRGMEFR